MSASDTIRRAWQGSGNDGEPPALDKVRKDADRFYRVVRRRNRLEYLACALIVPIFGWGALVGSDPVYRAGCLLVVLGTLLVAWQLHRKAAAVAPPEAAAAQPILAHQRAQLARQRDALAGIWLWYLGPLAPGLLVLLFRKPLAQGPAALLSLGFGAWLSIAVGFGMFAFLGWVNHRESRRLDGQVKEIDMLLGEGR